MAMAGVASSSAVGVAVAVAVAATPPPPPHAQAQAPACSQTACSDLGRLASWTPSACKEFSVSEAISVELGTRTQQHTPSKGSWVRSRSRRLFSLTTLAVVSATLALDGPAQARDRRSKKDIPVEDYQTTSDGLKFYDLIEGKGPQVEKGQTVLVHFDCIFRGIDAVSSRESKLLAGNRIIAQPYEFIVGSIPGKERKREFVENANGLFSAQAAPKPPPALYSATVGMRVGGKRTVIVPPEAGYGNKGLNEIPPGGTFQMNVELLGVSNDSSAH